MLFRWICALSQADGRCRAMCRPKWKPLWAQTSLTCASTWARRLRRSGPSLSPGARTCTSLLANITRTRRMASSYLAMSSRTSCSSAPGGLRTLSDQELQSFRISRWKLKPTGLADSRPTVDQAKTRRAWGPNVNARFPGRPNRSQSFPSYRKLAAKRGCPALWSRSRRLRHRLLPFQVLLRPAALAPARSLRLPSAIRPHTDMQDLLNHPHHNGHDA